MGDQDGDRQNRIVMEVLNPAENIDAVALHLGERQQNGIIVHSDRLAMIRAKESPGLGPGQ
jgi:hypothetical protein